MRTARPWLGTARTLAVVAVLGAVAPSAFAKEKKIAAALENVPTVEPSVQAFLNAQSANAGAPFHSDIALASPDGGTSGEAPRPEADLQDVTLEIGEHGPVAVHIVRPKGVTQALPAVIYCHGGGWAAAASYTYDRLIRELAVGAHVAIVFVNYTPAPKARFPVADEQVYAVAAQLAVLGSRWNLDGGRLAIAGDGVGGDIAAAVTLMAKQRGGPRFAFQALFYPVTDAGMNTESYRKFAAGPWLTASAMQWFWDAYAPNKSARTNPLISPLCSTVTGLERLPPALVITVENDVLCDEGEAYARKLIAAGVPVTAVRYQGTIHDFMMLDGISQTSAARSAIALACGALSAALQP